jgi:hypothetical protein
LDDEVAACVVFSVLELGVAQPARVADRATMKPSLEPWFFLSDVSIGFPPADTSVHGVSRPASAGIPSS